MLINNGFGNPKGVSNGGERERNINKKKKSDFYKSMDVHSVTNAMEDSVPSIYTQNIVNQLGKHDFYCGQILLAGRQEGWKLFLDQMNRNHLELIPRMRNKNCCTTENLRFHNFAGTGTF